jgi:hypothetical protein
MGRKRRRSGRHWHVFQGVMAREAREGSHLDFGDGMFPASEQGWETQRALLRYPGKEKCTAYSLDLMPGLETGQQPIANVQIVLPTSTLHSRFSRPHCTSHQPTRS